MLLLIGTCLASLLALLTVTTRAQDDLQRIREQQSIERALRTAGEMTTHDLQDYAKWDDAVRHITQHFDANWMADNVVAYLADTQGYSHVVVLDGNDQLTFVQTPRRADPASKLVTSVEFRRSIKRVRGLPVDGKPIVSGFSRVGSVVYIYAVAQIVPLTPKVHLSPGSTHLLAIARPIDQAFLSGLSENQHVRELSLSLRSTSAGARAAIPGSDGKPQAWLTWQPGRPGGELRRRILPVFLLVGALTLAAGALIVRLGARTIKALQLSETHARYLALHDPLTGLPNRRALMEQIESRVGEDVTLTLLWHDLDGFKDVNDVYGHGAGDAVLRQVQERLTAALPGVFVARVGGDEFAALLTQDNIQDAELASQAVLDAFALPFLIGSYRIRIGVSIGCAGAEETDLPANELLRRADAAMYAAKAQGKGCCRTFQSSMDQVHRLRISMEKDLGEAIAAGGIEVVYQPIVDASTGKIVCIEALSRWSHPKHGIVSPDVFIPLAEQVGMIDALGRHVLRQACQAAAALPVVLSVNLSPAQFWDRSLVGDIRAILEDANFPPDRLQVEITESYLLRQPEAAAAILTQLRTLGIKVALDDFGTGFASIGYLRQLPLDHLKIDKQFIAPLATAGQGFELVSAISSLAASIGLAITAEGVETHEQAALARLAGCTQLQGWLFGRPMPISQVSELLREDVQAQRHRAA
ncbi:EAL domain-containing protein [Novosphingobium sp. 9U]|uniref:bifunctional diguanylate cyclase/phosphodiesterase n=1 Tax=Novosphingobium sp. 9U TaxID=2653158 RepID=UPI001F167939|nr:EAL domain-containing protein [Novosphingobium sp. 9U]